MTDPSTEAIQALLQEVLTNLPPDRHASFVINRAGWHTAHCLV